MTRLMFDHFREPWQWLTVNGLVIVLTWRKTPWMMAHERGDHWQNLKQTRP